MSPACKPPNGIVMMEDHDRAYHAWKERGVKNRTLVHVDAHIDFGWLPDTDISEILNASSSCEIDELLDKKPLWNPFSRKKDKMMHMGNYICPAMRDGIVDKLYWVVPDPTWNSSRGQRELKKNMRWVLGAKRHVDKGLQSHDDRLSCRIFNKDIIVTPLSRFPKLEEPVLLDIDVDFMLTPFIWNDRSARRRPWILPGELLKKVHADTMSVDTLTVAYSVNGGFTPMEYKYLGDELSHRFDGSWDEKMEKVSGMKSQGTIASLEEAITLDDTDPSLYFNLSLLYLDERGDAAKAREYYHKAARLDKSYAGAYNNYGLVNLGHNRLKAAEAEYEKFLSIDGDSPHILSGLGYVALGKKKNTEAERLFDSALARDPKNERALFGKAVACFNSSRRNDAEQIFLKIDAASPDGPNVHWYLGKISSEKREFQMAIDYYKKAVMAGWEGPGVHFELCLLYIKEGLYLRAREELNRFYKLLIKYILDRCSI